MAATHKKKVSELAKYLHQASRGFSYSDLQWEEYSDKCKRENVDPIMYIVRSVGEYLLSVFPKEVVYTEDGIMDPQIEMDLVDFVGNTEQIVAHYSTLEHMASPHSSITSIYTLIKEREDVIPFVHFPTGFPILFSDTQKKSLTGQLKRLYLI